MIDVKVINESWYSLPRYETEGAAGLDVVSTEDGWIQPGTSKLFKTGLFVEIPVGYEIQVRPRSGLAFKHQITVLNSPGTIDSDYRGEIGVILINHGNMEFEVKEGDRIAQLVLNKVEQINWISSTVISQTDRGTGGYGSTGTTRIGGPK